MGHRLAIGIVTGLPDLDVDPGQIGRVDLDSADLSPGQIIAHVDRDEGPLALGLAQNALVIVLGQLDQPGQCIERALDVARPLADQHDPVVLPVYRKRHAEAVDDAPARRRQEPQVDPVVLRQHGVAVGLDDLQIVHAPGQDGEQHGLPAADQEGAPGEGLGPLVVLAHQCHDRPASLPLT